MPSLLTTLSRKMAMVSLDVVVVLAAVIMAGPFLLMLATPFLLDY